MDTSVASRSLYAGPIWVVCAFSSAYTARTRTLCLALPLTDRPCAPIIVFTHTAERSGPVHEIHMETPWHAKESGNGPTDTLLMSPNANGPSWTHLELHMLLSCTCHALAASSQEGRQETEERTREHLNPWGS